MTQGVCINEGLFQPPELGYTFLAPQRKRSNGSANKLDSADCAAHDWYRFVLSYPPHLVRHYLHEFKIDSSMACLDPFCGTATTPVECKKLGIQSYGVESHPMAYLAGQVKTDWALDPDQLTKHAEEIAEDATAELRGSISRSEYLKLPEESASLLLSKSISPLPLHKTLVLLSKIRERSGSQFHRHELLALAKALVTSVGNLHFGPEVGVGPPKKDAAVIQDWLNNVKIMAADLRVLNNGWQTPSVIVRSDARAVRGILRENSVDAVITSPPYPNEKDYTRTTRLESVLLGLLRTKADLRAVKQGLMRSNTRNVYKGDDDDRWVESHDEIQRIATAIEDRRIAMKKTSGFERMYARVTKLYFGGMSRHFEDMKRVLRPGAKLAYIVGDQASYLRVMIRTGQLLADIAKSRGYEVLGIDLFRTRLSTATGEQLR
jgi:DNA modification methylase